LYRPVLEWSLEHRKLVLATAVGALVASLLIVPRLGSEFLPELNEGSIWVNINLPSSISVSEATRQCARNPAAIRTVPEVNSVVSKSGRPEDGTDPKLINMSEVLVDLKPAKEWRPGMDKEKIITQIDRALDAIPGIDPSFSQPIRDNVLESISQI